jgi:hypothetical protein
MASKFILDAPANGRAVFGFIVTMIFLPQITKRNIACLTALFILSPETLNAFNIGYEVQSKFCQKPGKFGAVS